MSEICLKLFVPPADDNAPRGQTTEKRRKKHLVKLGLAFLSLPFTSVHAARYRSICLREDACKYLAAGRTGDLEPVRNEENIACEQTYTHSSRQSH